MPGRGCNLAVANGIGPVDVAAEFPAAREGLERIGVEDAEPFRRFRIGGGPEAFGSDAIEEHERILGEAGPSGGLSHSEISSALVHPAYLSGTWKQKCPC